MAEVLSDQEIEALKEAMSSPGRGEIHGERDSSLSELVISKRLAPRLVTFLNVVFSRFTLNFRASLSMKLRRPVGLSIQDFRSLEFGRFMEELPELCWMEIFEIKPFEGRSLVVLSPEFAFVLIDLLCGGTGKIVLPRKTTAFAPLEQSLIKKFVVTLLKDLESAWKTVVDISIASVGSEFNPSLLTVYSMDEPIAVIPIKVSMEDVVCPIYFVIPHITLEPLKRMFVGEKAEKEQAPSPMAKEVMSGVLEARSEVSVILGEKEMSLNDILELKEGDVIPIGKAVGDDVEVRVEGILRFMGQPVKYKGNKAVKVTKIVTPITLEEVQGDAGGN